MEKVINGFSLSPERERERVLTADVCPSWASEGCFCLGEGRLFSLMVNYMEEHETHHDDVEESCIRSAELQLQQQGGET